MKTEIDGEKVFINKFHTSTLIKSPIMISIGRFKDIPKFLAEVKYNKGVEVGVFEGNYSNHLLKYNPNLTLYGVDIWTLYKGYNDYHSGQIEAAKKKAYDLYKKYGSRAIPIEKPSNVAVLDFEDESLDFVFIDGNHNYESCVEDVALWSKKVKKGGLIFGHDYDDYSNSRRWRDMNVINAIDGWTKSYKIEPWFVTTNNKNRCWLFFKK